MTLSSTLQKLLQRASPPAPSATRILASLHNPKSPPFFPNPREAVDPSPGAGPNPDKAEDLGSTQLPPWAFLPFSPFGYPVLPTGSTRDEGEAVGSGPDSVKAGDFGSTKFHPWAFLPFSPFGYPVISTGSTRDEGGEEGDGSGMWADSVKKKRKKKMNKHKLKKLRKRVGRQT